MTERIWANLRMLRRGSMNATASNRLANATTNGLVTAEVVDTRSHAITANGIRWKPGDWAIYRKSKRGKVPGPRASRVKPNLKGDTYNYVVEKFWMVDEVHEDGSLTMRTTRGKTHRIGADDPNLSRPSWFARLRWRERFVAIESQFGNSTYAA